MEYGGPLSRDDREILARVGERVVTEAEWPMFALARARRDYNAALDNLDGADDVDEAERDVIDAFINLLDAAEWAQQALEDREG